MEHCDDERRLERDRVYRRIRPQLERVLRGFEWDLEPTLGHSLAPHQPGRVRAVAWNVERGKRFEGLHHVLTRDPELRVTPKGTAICTFSLAVNRKFKDDSGGEREEVTYIDIEAWGKQGETAAQHLGKGRSVLVEGRLQERRWESDGQKRSKFEVVANSFRFIGRKGEGGAAEGAGEDDFVPPSETTDLEPF